MMRIRSFVAGVLCFLTGSFVLQAQQFTITAQTLVSSVRASLYQYDYTYQITADNNGGAATDVICTVSSSSAQTIVESGTLTFGSMTSGAAATSTTTLVIRQDRRYPFSWTNLQWAWSSSALTVGSPAIYPVSLFVGDTTLVTVSAQITSGTTGPPLVNGGLTLLQVDENNHVLAVLGTMHDDGVNGDEIAGDSIYSLQFSTNPTAAGQMLLRVSAQFQGVTGAVLSAVSTLPIGPQLATTQTIYPEGRTYNFPHGVVLQVPTGAVSALTTLEVDEMSSDQANAILANGNSGSHSKRFLGGFSTPSVIQFSVPVMATFPVLPLQFREIPLTADLDLASQHYALTPSQLTFHGNYGTADVELTQTDPPAVVGATPNDDLTGCLSGESPGDCLNRKVNCSSCLGNANGNNQCSTFADSLEPACCMISYGSQCASASGCVCCKSKTVQVTTLSTDTQSDDCLIAGEQVKLTYPDCPGAPTEDASISGEFSSGCPKDLKVAVTINPSSLTAYSCAPPIAVTGAIRGTSASTQSTVNFDSSGLVWSATGPLQLQTTPLSSVVISGATVNLHAIETQNPATLTAGLPATDFSTTVPVQVVAAAATVTPTQQTLLGPGDQFTPRASVDHNVCSPCAMTWSSDAPGVATVDANSGLVTAVSGGTANISGVINPTGQGMPASCQDCKEPYTVSLPVKVCSLSGTWTASFSGETISCAVRGPNGCVTFGGPKSLSGTATLDFMQNGTNLTGFLAGYPFYGSVDGNGNFILSNHVPCNNGTSACPAGLSGSISPDCSTLSGSFYDDRPRTIAGTYSAVQSQASSTGPPVGPATGPPVVQSVTPMPLFPADSAITGGESSDPEGTLVIAGMNLQGATLTIDSGDSGFALLGNPTIQPDGSSISQDYSIDSTASADINLLLQAQLGNMQINLPSGAPNGGPYIQSISPNILIDFPPTGLAPGTLISVLTLSITGQNLQNASLSTPNNVDGFYITGSATINASGTLLTQQYSIVLGYNAYYAGVIVQTPNGAAESFFRVEPYTYSIIPN